MKDLDDAKVPILIFSAGVGDVIDEALRQHGVMKPNVKVISNYMTYDSKGKLNKFSVPPINVFNKNESEVSLSGSYFQDVVDRRNVILLGDSIGDLQMSHGVHSPRTVLTIGFLNDTVSWPTYDIYFVAVYKYFSSDRFRSDWNFTRASLTSSWLMIRP